MLGIVTNVFGHQESIAAISLAFNATNGWLSDFSEKNNDILIFLSIWVCDVFLF